MRLTNPIRQNPLAAAVDTFSRDNRDINFSHLRSVSSNPYRWQATTRFKVRNNFQTNKHMGWVCFYSDIEMMLNRFGNCDGFCMNNFFRTNPRPMTAQRRYELSTDQYKNVGQEYAEFDLIEYVDENGVITRTLDHTDSSIQIFHDLGDAPVFVTSGYSIYNVGTGKTYYSIQNEPVNIQIEMDSFIIETNDTQYDICSDPIFESAAAAQPIHNGSTTSTPFTGTYTS